MLYHHWSSVVPDTFLHCHSFSRRHASIPVISGDTTIFCLKITFWAIRVNNRFRYYNDALYIAAECWWISEKLHQDQRCSTSEELAVRQTQLLERCHVVTALLPSFRLWPDRQNGDWGLTVLTQTYPDPLAWRAILSPCSSCWPGSFASHLRNLERGIARVDADGR